MQTRNAWIELDDAALRRNVRRLRAFLGPRPRILFVVKSNAYGHGMVHVARTAWTEGVHDFTVAHVDEAAELRRALPGARIIVMGAVSPPEAEVAAAAGADVVVADLAHARALSAALATTGATLAVHAKIDTGMGRLGMAWEEAPAVIAQIAALPRLRLAGACSHLASAGAPDPDFARAQAARFAAALARCEQAGLAIPCRHLANSEGLVRDPEWHLDAVRSGILLYGYPAHRPAPVDTDPILQWKTRVVQVKNVPAHAPIGYDSTYRTTRATRIATLDVGYADGYARRLGNRGFCLIGGTRRPVSGRVSMNLVTSDIGPDAAVRPGDEVVLLGRQGTEAIWADEIAAWCDTICYEVLTSIRSRPLPP